MTTSSGQTISLGKLCGEGSAAPSGSQGTKRVYQANIIRRAGGTPVIEVTFNGRERFEMIVDTGASGTLITQRMARALGVETEDYTFVNTASESGVRMPIGRVQSIEVDGASINDVRVAIAGPNLDIGLLGHDFFGQYDVTIKQNTVEFRPRS